MRDRFTFPVSVLKAEERDGRMFLTIYATDTGPDRHRERCSDNCLRGMLDRVQTGVVDLLNTHNDGVGFGKAVDGMLVDAGQFNPELTGERALLVDVELDPDFPQSRKLFDAAQKGTARHQFSIGGQLNKENPRAVFFERGMKVLNDIVLDHITVTRRMKASNPRTHIASAVFKSLDLSDDEAREIFGVPGDDMNDENKVSGSTALPLADRGRPWDKTGAINRVRGITGMVDADGNPTAKYRQAFFSYDQNAPKNFTSYKLPFADVVNGQLTAIPNAIIAVAAALRGARGGVNLSAADRAGVQRKVSTYYGKMRSKFPDFTLRAPWERGKEMLKTFGIDVEKGITNAFFEGETSSAGEGDDEHVHRFTARLNGDNGTLIGMTTSWSAGERHAHMIDLLGEDKSDTSDASRGDSHMHSLEMPSVKVITEDAFRKTLDEIDTEFPQMKNQVEETGLSTEQAGETGDPAAPVENTENIAAKTDGDKTPEAPAVESAEAGDLKKEVGLITRFINSLKGVSDPVATRITEITASLKPDMSGAELDEVAKSVIGLLAKIAETTVDRENLSVRTDKMLTVIEAAALGKDLPEGFKLISDAPADPPPSTDGPAAKTEEPPKAEPVETAAETDDEQKPVDETGTTEESQPIDAEDEMTPEQRKEFASEIGSAVAAAVVPAIVGQFRKDGLLPGETDNKPTDATDAPPPVEEPTTETAPETTEPAKTEPETPPADGDTDGDNGDTDGDTPDVNKVFTDTMIEVTKTLEGINGRLAALEGKPAPARSIAGQDGPPTGAPAKKGKFAGSLFGKGHFRG